MKDSSGKVPHVHKSRKWIVRVLAVVAASTLVLSGCSGNSETDPAASGSPTPTESVTPSPTPTAEATALGSLDQITVTGTENPEVDGPWPFYVTETQVQVLSAGSGPLVTAADSVVEVDYVGINARTGQTFDSSWVRGTATVFSLSQVVPGFSKAILNQQVGSRVLVAMTSADAYDSSGGNTSAGIELGDTLVFVIDIRGVALDAPVGESVAPVPGLPVVNFVDGTPQVTIPAGQNPPTELVVQPLIRGTGRATVAADVISIRYQAVDWQSGRVVADAFAGDPLTGQLSAMIPGLRDGLVGQTAGSRILFVIPPELAYPDGNEAWGLDKNATLVFVVDLLFLQPNS